MALNWAPIMPRGKFPSHSRGRLLVGTFGIAGRLEKKTKIGRIAVQETGVARHHGGKLRAPLKPLNTIECCVVRVVSEGD